MKEGAGNLMDGIKSGWSKGVEGLKKDSCLTRVNEST